MHDEGILLSFLDTEKILRELNLILISLHNMGTYYLEESKQAYEEETTRFIDDNSITARLSCIRGILSKQYYANLSEEQLELYYTKMEKLNYWEKPGDTIPPFEE